MTTSNDNSITITGISSNSITSTPYTISTMASDTITFPYTNSNSGTFTINSGSGYGTISSSSYDSIHSEWFPQTLVPFSNSWPDYVDFQKMAKEYPGLEIAYEKLKTTYKLCIDDWEEQKRNKNGK